MCGCAHDEHTQRRRVLRPGSVQRATSPRGHGQRPGQVPRVAGVREPGQADPQPRADATPESPDGEGQCSPVPRALPALRVGKKAVRAGWLARTQCQEEEQRVPGSHVIPRACGREWGRHPRPLKEPKQAHTDVWGQLACMHLCVLLNMHGGTSRPAGRTPECYLTHVLPP